MTAKQEQILLLAINQLTRQLWNREVKEVVVFMKEKKKNIITELHNTAFIHLSFKLRING